MYVIFIYLSIFVVVNTLSISNIRDYLKFNILIYEYGKTIKLKDKISFMKFVNTNHNGKTNMISYIQDIFNESPYGYVDSFIDNPITDIQVAVTVSPSKKRINVIFRGSDSLKDWLYNFNFVPIRLINDIYVHKGYYNQLHNTDISLRLYENLKKLNKKYSDYSIYISGHSAGAALSCIFAYDLLSYGFLSNFELILFGSPRIGNKNFKKILEDNVNITRIVNKKDIVSAFPFGMNYKHIAKNIYHFTDDKINIFNDDYNIFKFSVFNCYSIKDHYMEEYLKTFSKHY